MAVLKNNKILTNNNVVVYNADITSLQVVNTNAFQFKVITTGAIRVYWGDGTYVDVPTKSTYYIVQKTYSVTETYNIVIVNPENVTALYFQNGNPWYGERINTNVSWFKQFYNLTRLELINATFIGDLAIIINPMSKLTILSITSYTSSTTLSFNVSKCLDFWTRCLSINFSNSGNHLLIKGSLTDIKLNIDCEYASFFFMSLAGDVGGIIKTGYTKITNLTYYSMVVVTHTNFVDFDEIEIPNTLTYSYFRGITSFGNLINFNFKNYITFIAEVSFSNINLTNNATFINFIQNNCIHLYIVGSNTQIDLSLFTKTIYGLILISGVINGDNKVYGDITSLATRCSQLSITNCGNSNLVYGNIVYKLVRNMLWLSYIDCVITGADFKLITANSITTQLYLTALLNLKGDISGAFFAANYTYPALTCNYMSSSLIADITTFTYNTTFYYNTYNGIYFNNNPGFYGNLGNLNLWSNKSNIYLQNCAYTNIGGFVNNVFTQRNTCLKATGGVTNINVANNVDNNLLTGVLQRGSLGTYTGNQNDLTENQIDNLSNGLDYTGSGSNTAWTHKEKIWWLVNCKNSSTDNSSRYRLSSFSY